MPLAQSKLFNDDAKGVGGVSDDSILKLWSCCYSNMNGFDDNKSIAECQEVDEAGIPKALTPMAPNQPYKCSFLQLLLSTKAIRKSLSHCVVACNYVRSTSFLAVTLEYTRFKEWCGEAGSVGVGRDEGGEWLKSLCERLLMEPDNALTEASLLISLLLLDMQSCSVSLSNLPSSQHVSYIKTSQFGTMVTVKGNVCRASNTGLISKLGYFRCKACCKLLKQRFKNGVYTNRKNCDTKDCKGSKYAGYLSRSPTVLDVFHYADFQSFQVKCESNKFEGGEGLDSESRRDGESPSITVEVNDDLCALVSPGLPIKITGIVRAWNSQHMQGKAGKFTNMNTLKHFYIQGLHAQGSTIASCEEGSAWKDYIQKWRDYWTECKPNPNDPNCSKEATTEMSAPPEVQPNETKRRTKKRDRVAFGDADQLSESRLRDIIQVYKLSNPPPSRGVESRACSSFTFDMLVHSFCPNIVGHESIKAGLLLVLFSGTNPSMQRSSINKFSKKEQHSKAPIVVNSTRFNPHILLVGDAGTGKSQMLMRCNELAEKCVNVVGGTSTNSGLMASIVHAGSDTHLEAGALVCADDGICCIDEFDKIMFKDSVLLECMEQQSVSIAKSGIIAMLPARCSVVAAANPKNGRYDSNKSVRENLGMNVSSCFFYRGGGAKAAMIIFTLYSCFTPQISGPGAEPI